MLVIAFGLSSGSWEPPILPSAWFFLSPAFGFPLLFLQNILPLHPQDEPSPEQCVTAQTKREGMGDRAGGAEEEPGPAPCCGHLQRRGWHGGWGMTELGDETLGNA